MPDNSAPPFVDPRGQPPPGHNAGRGCGSRPHRASWAIFLVLFGIALFLSNVGILPIHDIWIYWPAYLIILGVSKLIGGHSAERTSGVVLTAVGTVFFASNRGWLRLHGQDWMAAGGVILIVVGIMSLRATRHGFQPMWGARRERPPRPDLWQFANANMYQQPSQTPPSDDRWLRDSAVFGGIKRRVETNQFFGGNIEAVFGSLDLDMRNSVIPPAQMAATLHVNCVFGSIKLRIPSHWRVSLQVASGFGATEDKTIPSPRTDFLPSTLIVTGSSAFGAVEVEN